MSHRSVFLLALLLGLVIGLRANNQRINAPLYPAGYGRAPLT